MTNLNTKTVTVFGGDGFVGRYVVQALLKAGAQVRVASRNPKRGWFLKAQANLGQVSFIAADITRPETLDAAVAGADGVVNLVGILKGDFDTVQRGGAANVAAAAKRAKVARFVQMSAIGADPESASRYGRTKGEAEQEVRKALPSAVILRPSIIFGREDGFINRFAGMIRMLPVVPVIRGAARFQPVYVGDVARAVVAALDGGAAVAGKSFALGGPEVMTMADINAWIARAIGRQRWFPPIPDQIAGLMARTTGFLPGAPMTWDQWLMLQKDNVVEKGEAGLEALGIEATPLDAVAPGWMVLYRRHGRFGAKAAA